MAPLSFKQMMTVNYRPGEDDAVNYYAHKRKRIYHGNEEVENEALTIQQRLARGRQLKRMKAKIKIGRERAKRKMADKKKLERRSQKAARTFILKKLTKGKGKSDLSFARRAEIEKRMDKPAIKKRIGMLAKRLFKDIRKKEVMRKKS
tara:strand:- start:421 stop:864 length:444 start_codon:yes stop_codon:yes gene_type:complete